MPRPRKLTPSYMVHASGRGRAVWTDRNGERQYRLLPGPFNSEESLAAFARLKLELPATAGAATIDPTDLTVNELMDRYTVHAEDYYRGPDGKPTSEVRTVKLVAKALRETYGDELAAELTPLKVKAVRQKWIEAGLARSECNRRVNLIRRSTKWAAGEELIPAAVYHGLTVVTGLKRGRTEAHETEPVAPVEEAVVDATLPYLNRHVRAMVEFQRLTGCRPGEVCIIRRRDIDTGGAVWLYRPGLHKNAYRGKPRVVAIGPKAQTALREFFTPDLDSYLFSPRVAAEEHHAERAAKRETPRYPSHVAANARKRVENPKRAPKERYDRASYGRAIARAVDLANKAGARAAKKKRVKWATLPHWRPNQLRHSAATRIRREYGIEAAQVVLGHARADVTQVYAERNDALAVAVAAKIG